MRNVTFREVCELFDTVESLSSRNDMTSTFSSFYKGLQKEDAQIVSYLVLGRVSPSFVKSEFNYSEKGLISLLGNLSKFGNKKIDIEKRRRELGDIGDTVQSFTKEFGYKGGELLLKEVYGILWKIVKTTGTGSVEKKNSIVIDVLQKLSPLESKYFARIICGSLRLGINSKTLLDVFSYVVTGDKEMREELNRAYGVNADIGYICSLIIGNTKERVEKELENVKIEPGVPVLARLVERVISFEEVFERFGEKVLIQNKYDGLRCQIHKFKKVKTEEKQTVWGEYMREENQEVSLFLSGQEDYEVRLFTRNLEDVTDMFPEIVESAISSSEESFILDSEILGWNDGRMLTFQETMQRRRKYGVKNMKDTIPVKAMAFDLLFLSGEDFLKKDTEERIEKLNTLSFDSSILIEETREVTNMDGLRRVFKEAVGFGHEGVIVKQPIGTYSPGVRNYEWIKLKKSMEKNLVDSVDLVAVGYNSGSGRRQGLGVGAVYGAIYNEKEDVFEVICKVGTGFSDQMLKDIFSSLSSDILKEKPKNIRIEDDLVPDVWVEPRVVFTVEADEITKKKGSEFLSLRFPRLVEWGRDKGVGEVTSLEELERMYKGNI